MPTKENILQKHSENGAYHQLVKKLAMNDEELVQYLRLAKEQFQRVLHQVEEMVVKVSKISEAIRARQRVAISSRYIRKHYLAYTVAGHFRVLRHGGSCMI